MTRGAQARAWRLRGVGIEEMRKKLTKKELAHLVFFFADGRKVEQFLKRPETARCATCNNALRKLGVVE